MKKVLYHWWKRKPSKLRKPLVFILGILLVIISPLVGSIPGPGGIALFVLGIAILGSEFDWALELKSFALETLPKEVKNRWQPTPRWQIVFDIVSLLLLTVSGVLAFNMIWWPMISFGTLGLFFVMFNRNRLNRLKKKLNSVRHGK